MQRAAIRCTLLWRHVLAARSPPRRLRTLSRLPNNIINGIPGRPLDAATAIHAAFTLSSAAAPKRATTRFGQNALGKIKNVKYLKNGNGLEVKGLSAGESE